MLEQNNRDPYGIKRRAALEKLMVDIQPLYPQHMSERCPSGKAGLGASIFIKPWAQRCTPSGWLTYNLREIGGVLGHPNGGLLPKEEYESIRRKVINPIFPPLVVRAHGDENEPPEEAHIHTKDEFQNWIKLTFGQRVTSGTAVSDRVAPSSTDARDGSGNADKHDSGRS